MPTFVVYMHHMRDTTVTQQDRAWLEQLCARAKEEVERCRVEVEGAKNRHARAIERLAHLQALLALDQRTDGPHEPASNGSANGAANTDRLAVDIAAQVLAERNEAMHYREIFEEVQHRGVLIKGANPANTLLTRMLRDGRFKPAGGRGCYVLDANAQHKHFRSERRSSR
jgi:hypothetical protein